MWRKFGRPEPGVGDAVAGGEAVAEGAAVVAAWNVEAAEVGAAVGLAAAVGPPVGFALPPQAAATTESVSATAVRARVGPRRVGTLRFSPIGGDFVGFVGSAAVPTSHKTPECPERRRESYLGCDGLAARVSSRPSGRGPARVLHGRVA